MNKQTLSHAWVATVAWIIRVTLGAVFVSAAIAKLKAPYAFLAGVYNYEMASEAQGIVIAIVVPWLELTIGLCLLTNVLSGGSHLAGLVLCGIFCIAQALAIHRGLQISCGCFGNLFSRSDVNYTSLLRSGALALAAAAGYTCWLELPSHRG